MVSSVHACAYVHRANLGAENPDSQLQEQPPVRFLVEHLRHMDVVRLSLFSDGQDHSNWKVQLTEVPAGATGPSVGESDARAYDGVPPSGSPRWTLTCSRGADASAVRLHVPPGLDAAQWTCHTRADHVEVRLRAHVHAAWMRDHDDGGEWSALEGALPLCSPQAPVRLRCRNCSAVVTEPMRQAYMLPSPGWRELAEEWFCGACCGNGQDTGELIAELEAKLSPGPARCLVGSTVCLVTADDATGAVTRPAPGPAEEAGPWRVVSCGECDAVLGMTAEEAEPEQREQEGPSARTVTLIKHRMATHGAGEQQEDAFRGCVLQSALAVDLLAAREVHNTRRFSFFALQPPCRAMQLVLVSTDGYVCQGRLLAANKETDVVADDGAAAGGEAEDEAPTMRAALKVMYRVFDSADELRAAVAASGKLQQENQNHEDIWMVNEELQAAIHVLQESTAALPPSCRRFQKYSLGHLYGPSLAHNRQQHAPTTPSVTSTDPLPPPPPPPPSGAVGEMPISGLFGRRRGGARRVPWGMFCVDNDCGDCEPDDEGAGMPSSHNKRSPAQPRTAPPPPPRRR